MLQFVSEATPLSEPTFSYTGGKVRLATAVIAATVLGTAALPASGQRAPLAMLDQIEPGQWELRQRDASNGVAERLCLRDGRAFIQLRHPQQQCERFVVSDQPGDVVVQYTCHGRGYGRTHVRKESGRIVHIESQGIAGGLPFNFVAEARRIGECAR